MRVLYLYKDYYPVLGGIENHVRMLAEGLRELGVETQVLVTNTGSHSVSEAIGGVPVTKTGRQANISSAPLSLGFFPAVRRLEAGVDVAHAHFPYPPGEVAQLLLGRSRRFVLTYHSDIVKQRVLGALYRPLLWLLLRRVDLITVSNPVYIQTSRYLRPVANKCRVIHHGQDLARFEPTSTSSAAAAAWRARFPDRPLLLFVGRLRHYKGVDVLLRAMTAVEQAHLVVVGIGPMSDAWQALARELGLQAKVSFLGEAPDADVLALYQAADLFVLPSTNRAETWGAVQIEAMASGLPVICTELGTGTSYVNQDGVTGLVVPPNEPGALAAAIQTLIANPDLRRRLGQQGLRRAAEQFSTAAMLQNMLAFYQEALAQPRP